MTLSSIFPIARRSLPRTEGNGECAPVLNSGAMFSVNSFEKYSVSSSIANILREVITAWSKVGQGSALSSPPSVYTVSDSRVAGSLYYPASGGIYRLLIYKRHGA